MSETITLNDELQKDFFKYAMEQAAGKRQSYNLREALKQSFANGTHFTHSALADGKYTFWIDRNTRSLRHNHSSQLDLLLVLLAFPDSNYYAVDDASTASAESWLGEILHTETPADSDKLSAIAAKTDELSKQEKKSGWYYTSQK